MTTAITIGMIIIYVAIMMGIGVYTARQTRSVSDFVLGSHSVGSWLTAFAYGTSYFSAVVFIGYAGQFGWTYGVSAAWVGIGNALLGSLLAWIVLGRRTRIMTQSLGAKTMPEYFEKRWNSKGLKIAAALIVFVFLIPYTASVYNGLSRLFNMAFQIESEGAYKIIIIVMALLTAIYVILGGYAATAINDFIQGIVMLLGIIAVIVAVILNNGGFSEAIISLSQIPAEGSAMQGPFVSFFGPDLFNLLGVVILTSLGTWGLPQMVQKFYAIKTGPAIKQGAIISTIFAFVVAGGSYFLGGFGRLYEGQIEYAANGTPIYDSIIPTMLSTLPDVLIGLVIVLVLSASMSTLSSLVLTSSSTLTIDFINGNIIKNMSEKKQLVWMRGLLVVFIAISALIALFQYHSSVVFIAQLMGYSWGALAGSFLGPFLWGLYSGRISKASVWCSFAVGVGLTAVNMGLALSGGTPLIASPINCGALCMILSLVIVPVVSLFTPAVPFQIKPPTPESAIDREYDRELAQEELESATVSAAADV